MALLSGVGVEVSGADATYNMLLALKLVHMVCLPAIEANLAHAAPFSGFGIHVCAGVSIGGRRCE